ncbi:hypothetical protein C8J56DRAFT_886705 [Mycena floridula]|nr:hypothetical protein C8J56DRAFT_886705 [Mycena floridula]
MSPPRGWHISLSTWSDAFLILLSFDDTVMPDSYLDGAQEMSRLGLPSYYHTYQTMKSQEIGRPTDRGQGKVFFLALGWVIAREPTAWWPPWQTHGRRSICFSQRKDTALVGRGAGFSAWHLPKYAEIYFTETLQADVECADDVEGDRDGDVGGVTQRCDACGIVLDNLRWWFEGKA